MQKTLFDGVPTKIRATKAPRDRNGRFIKCSHWRPQRLYWSREWLQKEYGKGRSASEIASDFGITANAIEFWFKKHGIQTRTVSEARKVKKWGALGPANPMYGRRGSKHHSWKGGLTPVRQKIYARAEWKVTAKRVKARDKVCRLCGSKVKLEIHHIEPFCLAPLLVFDLGNLILLCEKCHRRTKGRERWWRKRFYRLIGETVGRTHC